jgi:hypothetical protein
MNQESERKIYTPRIQFFSPPIFAKSEDNIRAAMVWQRDKENWASGNALVLKDEVQRAKKADRKINQNKYTYLHAQQRRKVGARSFWGSLSYLSFVS